MTPFVEDLCKRHLSITFVKVDVDDQPYLSKSENVSFVPTFKIYKNGSKIKELAGPTHEDLERAIYPFSS
jgi:DnaJ family protein C protein 7